MNRHVYELSGYNGDSDYNTEAVGDDDDMNMNMNTHMEGNGNCIDDHDHNDYLENGQGGTDLETLSSSSSSTIYKRRKERQSKNNSYNPNHRGCGDGVVDDTIVMNQQFRLRRMVRSNIFTIGLLLQLFHFFH